MNPEFKGQQEENQLSGTGSFKEPRTIPEKWDVSGFTSSRNPNLNGAADSPEGQVDQVINDSQESSTSCCPESFPQPRTIPGNWDIYGLK